MTWGFKGYRVVADTPRGDDWRADEPWRREPQEIHTALRRRFWLANVAMPHVLAVVLGSALFLAAALHAPGFEQLHPQRSPAGRLPVLAAHHLPKRPHI